MAAFGPGPAEIAVLLMFLGGFGLPLGVPPQPENPAMGHVAPAECVLYASWAGMAEADPQSDNHTEKLLAEPEVLRFARSLEKTISEVMRQYAQDSRDPKGEQLAKLAPLWAKTIITRSTAVFATRLEVDRNKLDFRGGVLVDGGDDAAALVDALVQLLSSEDQRAKEVTIGKVKFFRFASQKGALESEVTIGAAGNYVLLGVGEGIVEGMVERLRAKQTPDWLTAIGKRLPLERRASVSYVNTQALVDAFLPMAGPDAARMAESLGLRDVGEMVSVTGLDKEGMISRTLLRIGEKPRGLLTLLDGEAIMQEKLDFIPRDATIASACSLNTQQIYNVAQKFVSENAPRGAADFDAAADQFEKEFGLRLKEDVLASLGNVWTISMSPADGWLGLTATVEVVDRNKLQGVLQRVALMLGDARGRGDVPRIESTKFGKHEIQTLAIRGMPIRPAWCVTESRLIFSLTPQAIKGSLDAREDEVGLFRKPEFADAFKGEGTLVGITYQDTPKVFESTYGYVTLLIPMMTEMMDRPYREGPRPALFDPASLPSARSIHRHLRPSMSVTRRTRDGLETEVRQTFPTPNIGATGPVAVALLLPAVQSARVAARRTQSQNNLKQIMLALHNFHDTYKGFPPAYTFDKAGKKPALSWRVMILPFIEEAPLYEQFHLDEPWDSEHNKKLIAKMPAVYKSPQSTAGEGKTVYLGIGGEHGIFEPPARPVGKDRPVGLSLSAITDGTSNTIAVVESADESAVIWTRPDDLTPDEKAPLKGLLGLYPGGFNAALCDGSVRFISDKIDPKVLINLFQRDDGNPVDLDFRR